MANYKAKLMKNLIHTLILLQSLVVVASAQTVSTPIVGFLKLTLPAGSASLVSFPLNQAPLVGGVFSGKTGNTLSTQNSLSSLPNSLVNQANEPLYYAEVKSGPKAGLILEILSKSSNSISVADAAQISGSESFEIKKFTTLGSVFGESNSAGLLGGNDISNADVVWTVVNGTWTPFYFYDDGFGGEIDPLQWQTPGSAQNRSDERIDPDQGVLVVRKAGGPSKTVTVTGSVKVTPSFVPFTQGVQIVTNPQPVALSLTSMNLKTGNSATGLLEGNDVSTSDVVYKLNNGTWIPYFVYNDGFGGEIDPIQWATPGSNDDQGAVQVQPGEALLIVKRNSSPVTWSPSFISFNN